MFTNISRGSSHILLDMPHSGTLEYRNHRATDGIPPLIVRNLRFESPEVRRTIAKGCDAAVPVMSNFHGLLRQEPVTGIWTTLPRAFIDVNRAKDDVSGLALEGADPEVHHNGVITSRTIVTRLKQQELRNREAVAKAVAARAEQMLHQPYTREQFDELMRECYDPYHEALQAEHRRIVDTHGACIHLSLHSIAPYQMGKIDGTYVVGPRAARGRYSPEHGTMPDVILIHNDFQACDSHFVTLVRQTFESFGLLVDDGRGPLLGDNGVTGMYGKRNHVHVLGIEHVTHFGEEPGRLNGSTTVNRKMARRHQAAYRQVIKRLKDI